MKPYDLSQPLNADVSFWPYYPPFEVKYIKRKAEHGVNAQYIQTSNHMGTHLDAPRHFVTGGMTIDQIPLEWLYGPGVIVDLTDEMDELAVYTPEMIEERVEVRRATSSSCTPAGTATPSSATSPTRRSTSTVIPAPIPTWSPGCSRRRSTSGASTRLDRPSDEPADRPFPGQGHARPLRPGARAPARRSSAKEKMDELFPDSAYQLTHNALFPHNCMHVGEPGRRHRRAGAPEPASHARCLPVEVQGRRGGVLSRDRLRVRVSVGGVR